MPRLNYHVTSVIHLQLELFHNAGLTPSQTKEEIEKIQDGTMRVWCEASGLNHNWNVRTIRTGPCAIVDLVQEIERRLNGLLMRKINQGELPLKNGPRLLAALKAIMRHEHIQAYLPYDPKDETFLEAMAAIKEAEGEERKKAS